MVRDIRIKDKPQEGLEAAVFYTNDPKDPYGVAYVGGYYSYLNSPEVSPEFREKHIDVYNDPELMAHAISHETLHNVLARKLKRREASRAIDVATTVHRIGQTGLNKAFEY